MCLFIYKIREFSYCKYMGDDEMSLDKLFSDRKTRKYIKESVYNGADLG